MMNRTHLHRNYGGGENSVSRKCGEYLSIKVMTHVNMYVK